MKRSHWAVVLTIIAALPFTSSAAPSEEVRNVFSRGRNATAMSDPSTNETTVYQSDPAGHNTITKLLWTFPKALCAFEVSDDGSAIVAETFALPLTAKENEVLLTFIVRGRVIREITIKQLMGSISKLERV